MIEKDIIIIIKHQIITKNNYDISLQINEKQVRKLDRIETNFLKNDLSDLAFIDIVQTLIQVLSISGDNLSIDRIVKVKDTVILLKNMAYQNYAVLILVGA